MCSFYSSRQLYSNPNLCTALGNHNKTKPLSLFDNTVSLARVHVPTIKARVTNVVNVRTSRVGVNRQMAFRRPGECTFYRTRDVIVGTVFDSSVDINAGESTRVHGGSMTNSDDAEFTSNSRTYQRKSSRVATRSMMTLSSRSVYLSYYGVPATSTLLTTRSRGTVRKPKNSWINTVDFGRIRLKLKTLGWLLNKCCKI